MKSKIRKISALILSICSMASISPMGFCTGVYEKAKQFLSKDDYWALENVIKKAEHEVEKRKSCSLVPNNGNIYFPGMSTYIVGSKSSFKPLTFDELYDEIGDEDNVDTIIYKPGSFNINLFLRVLDMNNIAGNVESIEPLDLEKDYEFPMSIVNNGYKYVLGNSITGKTIEFDFVFGKTLPPQGEIWSFENAIKAYNQFVDIFYSSEVYSPYGIDLRRVDENDINSKVVSDIVEAGGSSIVKGCFKNCRFFKTLSMPNTKTIYEEAFENCVDLKNISMPLVSDIGSRAFFGCKSLRKISMPNAKFIDSSAFEGCENLESIHIPKVEYISKNAFKGCKNLKVIDIPKSARVISANAFEDCSEDLRIIYGGTIYKNINQFIDELMFEE